MENAEFLKDIVLVRVCIAGKDTMTKATLIKENINWGWLTVSEVLVHYHHGRKQGSVQTEVGLEELNILLPHQKAARRLSSILYRPLHRKNLSSVLGGA